jgi:hypothetical protein
MSLAQIYKAIEDLSAVEQTALSQWLHQKSAVDDESWQNEAAAIAEQRSAEVASEAKKLLSEQDFWRRIDHTHAARQS